MSALLEKQMAFAETIATFVLVVTKLGFRVTFGEAWRPRELYKKHGDGFRRYGAKLTLHGDRLALDLNLFRWNAETGKWEYLRETEDHRAIGELWEQMGGTWGGRFDDGNHYSFEHEGRK